MHACTGPNGFKTTLFQNLLLKDLNKPIRDNQLNLDLVLKLELRLLNDDGAFRQGLENENYHQRRRIFETCATALSSC